MALYRILAAQALSSMGTSVSTVALAVMVFDLTGSVLHMGGILAASALPLVVMSFVGGALLDRYEGRRLMVAADVGRAALMFLLPVVALQSVGLIYVVAAAIGVFSAVFNPSQVKVVGEIVPVDRLVRANSYLSISREGAELGGYLVGGVLVALVGYAVTFAIDGLSYIVSAALLFGLPAAKRAGDAVVPRLGRLLRESPRVLGRLWANPALRTNLLFALLPMTVMLMATPNAYGLALQVYDRGPQGFALMETCAAIGWIVGGVAASRLNYRGDRNSYVYVSFSIMALCFLGVGLSGSFWVSVALLSAAAVANVGVIVGSMTLFQEIEPRPDKGRMIAVRAGFGQMSATVGLLLGGVLGEWLGEPTLFVVVGTAGLLLPSMIYLPYRASKRRAREQVPGDSDAEPSLAPGTLARPSAAFERPPR
jgi:MFS family permease